ncbi:MAG: DUF4386 domain-containing protein [Cyclobacteriaceae bacterium]|nr:DUF4386 domain-containing protein [Cyclobacteriaceae bacterium]
MSSLRKTSLVAGVFYLLTFVSIPTLALYGKIHQPDYLLSSVPDADTILGAVLEIIVALACIGSAVVLYPVLRKQNESAALALVSARVLEASTIFLGVAFLLTVVGLRQSGAGADALVASHTLVILYDRVFLIGQSLMPAINDLLLGFLFYHSRLIPRSLSIVGIIGGPLLLVGDGLVLFNVIGQHAPTTSLFAIPVALFELILGIWLVAKGFSSEPKPIDPVQNLYQLSKPVVEFE